MSKHKTAELEGALLDAAVAEALGWRPYFGKAPRAKPNPDSEELWRAADDWPIAAFSSDWMSGGPIIERERIVLEPPWAAGAILQNGGVWAAWTEVERIGGRGRKPLIAAMRAYVQAKLGDEVELP